MELAHDLLSTRRRTMAAGALSAALAVALLLLYLDQYRSSVSSQPALVLVAKQFIAKGTPGEAIGTAGRYELTNVPGSALEDGALTDPASLRRTVAATDIYPGQQLVGNDFAAASEDAVRSALTGEARAISVPLDSAHGLVDSLQSGDHVDVYGILEVDRSRGKARVLKMLTQDAAVLQVPRGESRSDARTASDVVLQVDGKRAAEIAYAADEGEVWLVLRPASGARPSDPGIVSAGSIVFGRDRVPRTSP
ncbi:MAG TPA: Flp pilus assembly protein CpaB [Gaiellaceae bacterium]|nr:Flp pilus assembly protein CpaB [Gaiellaceae bacterium]